MYRRIANSIRCKGIVPTVRTVFVRFQDIFFNRKRIFYYCNLSTLDETLPSGTADITLTAFTSFEDIPPETLDKLTGERGNLEIIGPFLRKYFSRKGILWLITSGDNVVGWVWTLIQGINGFWCIPTTAEDAIIIAQEVFPSYRGRGIGRSTIEGLLRELKAMGVERVYVSSLAKNIPQRLSLKKTPLQKVGSYYIFDVFGKTITIWDSRGIRKQSLEKE